MLKYLFAFIFVVQNSYGADLFRTFHCKLQNYKNTEIKSVLIQDYKWKNSHQWYEYYSQIYFYNIFGKLVMSYQTEMRDEDIQETRDDNPNSRSGWGGTAFYINEPLKLGFFTKALKEQIDVNEREYRGAFVKFDENGDYIQVLDDGYIFCNLK